MTGPKMTVVEARALVGQCNGACANPALCAATRTIVHQDVQIQRLQAALREMMTDLRYAEKIVHDMERLGREWREPRGADYGLLPGDMKTGE